VQLNRLGKGPRKIMRACACVVAAEMHSYCFQQVSASCSVCMLVHLQERCQRVGRCQHASAASLAACNCHWQQFTRQKRFPARSRWVWEAKTRKHAALHMQMHAKDDMPVFCVLPMQ
jgi:hypothetical protein